VTPQAGIVSAIYETVLSIGPEFGDDGVMIIIHRRGSDRSMNRFYALAVHRDLISGWTLQREWGRVGSPGRVVIEPFPNERDAAKAGAVIEAVKRRRGYRDQENRLRQ